MTDSVQLAIIVAIPSTIAALASGVAVVMVAVQKGTILKLEHNTNSMKDALVKITGEAEHAKDKIEGKLEVAAEAIDASLPATVRRQEKICPPSKGLSCIITK